MSSSSILSPIALAEKDRLRGYENYTHWKLLMEAHGKPKGLHKYWNGKIEIPSECVESSEDNDSDTDLDPKETEGESTSVPKEKGKKPTKPIIPPLPTPLHSTTPSALEYELRENVALSSILINVVDIHGSGIDPSKSAHKAWKHLQDLYGRTSDRARNLREEELAACKLVEGGKVAGEDGHIEKMRLLRQRANEAGARISDSRFITKLLDSFPDSWDPIITPMYGEMDLNKIIMNLTTHAERLTIRESRSKAPTKPDDAVRALEATVLALKCINMACGKTGHVIADCFKPGGGKAGQYPDWWKGRRVGTPVTANMATTETPLANQGGLISTGVHYALSATIAGGDDINHLIALVTSLPDQGTDEIQERL